MRFNKKTILISGGNSGIGLAVAKQIIAEGGKVIITGRDQKKLDEALEMLGNKAIAHQSDVSRMEDINTLFDFVKKEVGHLDGLFANAGIAVFEPLEDVTEAHYDQLMDINVKGVFFTMQKALAHLLDGSSIVVNASIAGSKGRPLGAIYGASKAAVRSLTRSFAAGLLERKIRVNAVSPGPIETPIWHRDENTPKEEVDKYLEEIRLSNPMKRFGTAEEVSAAVCFFLADESSYITGSELFVDGGLTQL